MLDRQAEDGRPAALLAFDLDRFKQINDSFGHATGDAVLRSFADVLLGTLRPTNLAARIGGEEFVALIPEVDAAGALGIANRIREAFQNAGVFVGGRWTGATVSIGVAVSDGRRCDIVDILAKAVRCAVPSEVSGTKSRGSSPAVSLATAVAPT